MAEGARLESVWAGNRLVGSNPTPSAKAEIIFEIIVSAMAWVLSRCTAILRNAAALDRLYTHARVGSGAASSGRSKPVS